MQPKFPTASSKFTPELNFESVSRKLHEGNASIRRRQDQLPRNTKGVRRSERPNTWESLQD
jgi:hypothetical protein